MLTEEQEMLKGTASRIAESATVIQPADLARLDRAGLWAALAQTGLLGMRIRDKEGAPLTSGVEVMLVAEGLAGAIAPAPFVGVALAADLLARADAPAGWLDDIAEGRTRYSLLLDTALDQLAQSTVLKGSVCIDAEGAAWGLTLTADGRIARIDLTGLSQQQGVDLSRPLVMLPAMNAAPEPVGRPLSEADLQAWTALALTLVCADIVGVLRAGLRRAVDYAKTRIQYGAPIGSFQAVQHMCADMLVETEAAASVTKYAAWSVDALEGRASLLAARTAKACCSAVAQQVGERLMQAYGGIGQVWDHEAHLRVRRAMFDRKLFGDESRQLLAIADARAAQI